MTDFERWINQVIVDRYGGVNQRLADAIDISLSVFLRSKPRGSFGTETLLRLAVETGKPGSWVLRLAGKGETADLIESLYGPSAAKAAPLTAEERELLRLLRGMEDGPRGALLAIARSVKKAASPEPH